MTVGQFRELDILKNTFGGENRIKRVLTSVRKADEYFPGGRGTIDLWEAAELLFFLASSSSLGDAVKSTEESSILNLLGTSNGAYSYRDLKEISIGQLLVLMIVDPADLNRLEISTITKRAYAYFSDKVVEFKPQNEERLIERGIIKDPIIFDAELKSKWHSSSLADTRTVLSRNFFLHIGQKLKVGHDVIYVGNAKDGELGHDQEYKLFMLKTHRG